MLDIKTKDLLHAILISICIIGIIALIVIAFVPAESSSFDDINLTKLNQCKADKLKIERRLQNATDALNISYRQVLDCRADLERCENDNQKN